MNTCNIFPIWEAHKALLHAYIKKRVSDPEDANDLLQEILIKSHRYCMEQKKVQHLKPWLYQIANHAIIDYHKGKNRLEISSQVPETIEDDPYLVSVDVSNYIEPLIRLLPDLYGGAIILSDLKGEKQQAIAEKMKLSLSATKSRIQRAREKLKEKFLACCEIEFGENGNITEFHVRPHCTELKNIL